MDLLEMLEELQDEQNKVFVNQNTEKGTVEKIYMKDDYIVFERIVNGKKTTANWNGNVTFDSEWEEMCEEVCMLEAMTILKNGGDVKVKCSEDGCECTFPEDGSICASCIQSGKWYKISD